MRELQISYGITWGAWPAVVKKALEGLDGIEEATVSFKKKRADVLYDQERVTAEDMITTISKVGFKANLMEGADGGSWESRL